MPGLLTYSTPQLRSSFPGFGNQKEMGCVGWALNICRGIRTGGMSTQAPPTPPTDQGHIRVVNIPPIEEYTNVPTDAFTASYDHQPVSICNAPVFDPNPPHPKVSDIQRVDLTGLKQATPGKALQDASQNNNIIGFYDKYQVVDQELRVPAFVADQLLQPEQIAQYRASLPLGVSDNCLITVQTVGKEKEAAKKVPVQAGMPVKRCPFRKRSVQLASLAVGALSTILLARASAHTHERGERDLRQECNRRQGWSSWR